MVIDKTNQCNAQRRSPYQCEAALGYAGGKWDQGDKQRGCQQKGRHDSHATASRGRHLMRTAMIGLVKQAGLGVAPEQAGHGD